LTAAHILDNSIGLMSDDIVDNGYYITRCRPSEGARLVYCPRDNSDLEFFDMSYVITDSQGGTNQVFNPTTEIRAHSATFAVRRFDSDQV